MRWRICLITISSIYWYEISELQLVFRDGRGVIGRGACSPVILAVHKVCVWGGCTLSCMTVVADMAVVYGHRPSHPCMAVVVWYRPSHPYNAGTEHVGFSPTRQALLATSAKRRRVLGESHNGMKGERRSEEWGSSRREARSAGRRVSGDRQ